jgi:hypothetical protein
MVAILLIRLNFNALALGGIEYYKAFMEGGNTMGDFVVKKELGKILFKFIKKSPVYEKYTVVNKI